MTVARGESAAPQKRTVLNVGGGNKSISIPSYYAPFDHVLLDIDPRGKPDIVCDARQMAGLTPGQFDAVYCSHNLEHYYAHEVPVVLAGFLHVLKPDGFAEIRVPDMDMLMHSYVERGMDIEDVLYASPAGPVRVRDVIYGFGPQIERSGQDFYAHRTGFTQTSLSRLLRQAGFPVVVRRPGRNHELLVVAFRGQPTAFHRSLLSLKIGPEQTT